MSSGNSGRLFSGGSVVVDLVLFEVTEGDLLDRGVPSSLISHFISQYRPAGVCRLKTGSERSDFALPLRTQVEAIQVIDSKTENVQLWDSVRNVCTKPGTHMVLLDTLHVLIERHKLGSIARLLCAARSANARVAFAAMVFNDSFDTSTAEALRSLASVYVSVRQTNGKQANGTSNTIEVWDSVALHICRRKSSGRVNIDHVTAKFDASNNILAEVVVVQNRSQVQGNDNTTRTSAGDQCLSEALNLPFKVQLTAKEQVARSAVRLPFVHHESGVADKGLVLHPEALQVTAGTCKLLQQSGRAANYHTDSETSSEGEDELFSEDV